MSNIVIVGGTGTLGKALIAHHYGKEEHKIICYSRDELKQHELKKTFPKVTYILGDIREGLPNVSDNIDIIYHVAALKHIDILEHNVTEALRTNVAGTFNLANYAVANKIPRFSFSSTDKAVFPINVYGNTKAICERYLFHLNEVQDSTYFRVFRWGNVIASRGSAIHSFKESLLKEQKIYLTHPDMTRFWIRIDDAVKFMVNETEQPSVKGIQIPPMKSAKVTSIIEVLAEKLGIKEWDYEYIGLRPGEKIHEFIRHDLNSLDAEKYTKDEIFELLKDSVSESIYFW